MQTSLNTGALFGIGQGGVLVLAGISFVATLGVIWWMTWGGASQDRFISVVLGMITGGILGNMYDRLGIWGTRAVRDWILFQYNEQYVWPNFNIADSLLVVGAALMMWHAFRQDVAAKQQEQQEDA
jgi:signal peptidase II